MNTDGFSREARALIEAAKAKPSRVATHLAMMGRVAASHPGIPDKSPVVLPAMIQFFVPGLAKPAGSKRAFKHSVTGKVIVKDDCEKSRDWKSTVAAFAMQHRPDKPLTGALSLVVTFYLPRPKGHYGTGANAARLKPSAPTYPTVKPDCSKLLRGLEDACTGILWKDDALIVDHQTSKRYAGCEDCGVIGAQVSVQELEAANG